MISLKPFDFAASERNLTHEFESLWASVSSIEREQLPPDVADFFDCIRNIRELEKLRSVHGA